MKDNVSLKAFANQREVAPPSLFCAVVYWCNPQEQQQDHLNVITMGRSKKHRAPVTTSAHKSTPKSLITRSTIRQFHVLLKRRAQLETESRTTEITKELGEIDQAIVSLGGLEQYQAMSVVGQSKERGGGSHKVLISWLREFHSPAGEGNKGTLKFVYLPSVRLEIHI